MRYSKLTIFSLLLIVAVTMLSCNRDDHEEIIVEKYIEESRYLINTSVAGFILSLDGVKIPKAKVSVGNRIVYSDDEGFYEVDNVAIDSTGALLKVEKKGFGSTIKKVIPRYNELVQMDVKLKVSSRLISINSDEEVHIENTLYDLNLSPSSLSNSDGSRFTGSGELEVIILGHTNAENLLPPTIRAITSNAKTAKANHLSGVLIKVTDENGRTLHNPNQDLKITLSNEVVEPYLVQKVFELDEYKNTWYEVDIIDEVGSNFIVLKCSPNKYYALSNLDQKIRVNGRFVANDGMGRLNMKYEVINEDDQIVEEGRTDEVGNYHFDLNRSQDYFLSFADHCSTSDKRSEAILTSGTIGNTVFEVGGLSKIQYSILGCENKSLELDDDFLQIEIKQIGKVFSFVTNKAHGSIDIPVCDQPFKVTIKNSKGIYYDELFSNDQNGEDVFIVQEKKICTEDLGAVLNLDNEVFSYEADEFYIAANPLGSDDLSIQIDLRVLIEIDDVNAVGKYTPNLVYMDLLSDALECENSKSVDCGTLEAEILEYGEKGERVKIKLTGTLNGVEIDAVFTNYKFS